MKSLFCISSTRPWRAPFGKNRGAIGWGILWLIGVPIPILVILFLLRGCT